MTLADFYDTAVALSFVGLIAVAAGWAIERWPEWRARHEAFAKCAQWRWVQWHASLYDVCGTVWFPCDPSPRPIPKAEWLRRAAAAYGVEPDQVHEAMLARYKGGLRRA